MVNKIKKELILKDRSKSGGNNDRIGKPLAGDCNNQRGEDMSRSSDYTMGLQITYYFR